MTEAEIEEARAHYIQTINDNVAANPDWVPPLLGQPTTWEDGNCLCGWNVCTNYVFGYPLCPRCKDHHRWWPECPGDDGP